MHPPRIIQKENSFIGIRKRHARRFIACLESEPLFWRAYFNILITCGLRRGECIGLQWRDIDPDKLTLTIERTVTGIESILTGTQPDKSHKADA